MSTVADTDLPLLRTLRLGDEGPRIALWQAFLRGRRLDPGPVDGQFGDQTHEATIAYQRQHGLDPDGRVGQQTLLRAGGQGFPIADQSGSGEHGSDFPPMPDFRPLITNDERAVIFGHFDFVPAPTADNREAIRILGDWQRENIVKVKIPQLVRITGARGRDYIWFHRKGADQVQALWRAWEEEDLLDLVLTWGGAFNARFVRGSTTTLSNHAFGSAFDLNYEWNRLGHIPALVGQKGSVRRLVPTANRHGFYWGGHFQRRPDGMHFEIAELLG